MPIVLTDTDFQRLAALDATEQLRLYQFLTSRLRGATGMETVVTVRLPSQVVERLKALAFRHQSTRSQLVRQAVDDFVRRNPL